MLQSLPRAGVATKDLSCAALHRPADPGRHGATSRPSGGEPSARREVRLTIGDGLPMEDAASLFAAAAALSKAGSTLSSSPSSKAARARPARRSARADEPATAQKVSRAGPDETK
jgi:hypothetical protein